MNQSKRLRQQALVSSRTPERIQMGRNRLASHPPAILIGDVYRMPLQTDLAVSWLVLLFQEDRAFVIACDVFTDIVALAEVVIPLEHLFAPLVIRCGVGMVVPCIALEQEDLVAFLEEAVLYPVWNKVALIRQGALEGDVREAKMAMSLDYQQHMAEVRDIAIRSHRWANS